MKNNSKYQCFICKKNINSTSKISHQLDPCSVIIRSNFDKDQIDQKEQVFFCHYECFSRVNNDDSVMYLKNIPTEREAIENYNLFEDQMNHLCSLLEKIPAESSFWEMLFNEPKGTWIPLKSIISIKDKLILSNISIIEEDLIDLLVMWVVDHSNKNIEEIEFNRKIIFISDDAVSTDFYIIKRF